MEEKKLCPYCGEEILAVAKKCKHCGEWLDKKPETDAPAEPRSVPVRKTSSRKWVIAIPLIILIVALGWYAIASNHHNKDNKEEVIAKADPVINFAEPEEDENGTVYQKKEIVRPQPAPKDVRIPKADNAVDVDCGSEEYLSLGESYEKGIGVGLDLETAFYYYEKASKTGDPAALNKLGNMYAQGKGCAKDAHKAATYYLAAAEKGNKYAQHNIAFCYWDGVGIEKDREKAVMWMRRSAAQGFEKAQKALKTMGVE